ncbi:uncharacterized protein [Penaeus vannamei]|uniref:uncharacterized protein n=1 Tax=Penaeus vannamei TaxID=6689 RepID=UPI00387F61D8
MALAIGKTFDQKAELSRGITRLKEFGIIEYLKTKDLFNATECLKPLSSSVTSGELRALDIVDFLGVFAIYATGISVAAAVFVLELTLGRRRAGRGREGREDTEDARRTAGKGEGGSART